MAKDKSPKPDRSSSAAIKAPRSGIDRDNLTGGHGAVAADQSSPPKPYVVLARKYRPSTFDDLIGQDAMVTTLRNAFASGRIAHGYMLTGVRGIGKTTTARILARALNYETDTVTRPTVDMPVLGRHCAEIIESRHPDVIEMDAASNTGIDNVREIIENARYRPLVARNKVFIIDEVHMLSKGAFNALLKTLEEPPEHVRFIFATTEIRKVPVTVLSRCQRFDLRRVDVPLLSRHLAAIAEKEGAQADAEALLAIARAAEGSVRDGLSILDQAIAMGSGTVTENGVRAMLGLADRGRIFDLLELIFRGEAGSALRTLAALYKDGASPNDILASLAEAAHVTARAKVIGADAPAEDLSAEERRRAAALSSQVSIALLARAWQMLVKGLEDAARAPNPLAAAEMVLIRLAYTADLPSPDEIIKALGGAPSRQPTAAPAAPRTDDRPALRNEAGSARQPASLAQPPPGSENPAAIPEDMDADPTEDAALDLALASPGPAPLRSFDDVVALVGEKRDAKLRVHLEEHVSLVRFDAAAGSIDLYLMPGAPPEIANELREKLNHWTQRRWMVMLSKSPGEPPIGQVRREREAAEIARLSQHPAVAAVLRAMPGAKIAEVRPLRTPDEDESAAG